MNKDLKETLRELSEEGQKVWEEYDEEGLLSEILLEKSMREAGMARYDKRTSRSIELGREDGTSYGVRLLAKTTTTVAEALDQWVTDQSTGRGRRHNALGVLKLFEKDYRVPAALSLKAIIAGMSRSHGAASVAIKIGNYLEDELQLMALASEDKYNSKRVQKALAERGDYNKRHAVVRAAMADRPTGSNPLSKPLKCQLGILMIKLIEESTGLFEYRYRRVREAGAGTKQAYIKATPETQDWIKNHRDFIRGVCPIVTPMVVKPLDWSPERVLGGGYMTRYVPQQALVKRMRCGDRTAEIQQADMPEVYRAMNAVQSTGLRINKRVLKLLQHFTEAQGDVVEALSIPRANDFDVPERPVGADDDPQLHKEWKARAAAMHDANASLVSKRVSFFTNIATAEQYAEYDEIFIPYQADFRGRIYALTQGGINPQGPDYVKGLLHFSLPSISTCENISWLEVHIANLFGIDKVSFEERIEWTRSRRAKWLDITFDPIEHDWWAFEADKPWQAIAAILEYGRYLIEGPGAPIHIGFAMDGSCSGLQHLGMALACERTGKAVNLSPADKPQDIYQEVADVVIERLREISRGAQSGAEAERIALEAVKKFAKDVAGISAPLEVEKFIVSVLDSKEGKQDEHVKSARKLYQDILAAEQWLRFGVTRKTCKRGCMTFAYGSAAFGMTQQLLEDIVGPNHREVMQARQQGRISSKEFSERHPFFGDGHGACVLLGRILHESVQQVVLKAAQAMNWMQSVAKIIAKERGTIRWTSPTGFPVIQDYRKSNNSTIDTKIHGTMRVQLRISEVSEDIDPRKQANAISPNVVHSLDAAHLIKTINACLDEGIEQFVVVHDSFMVPLEHTERLFQIIREEMYRMYEEGGFEHIANQLIEQVPEDKRDKLPPMPEFGKLDRASVTESLYTFA